METERDIVVIDKHRAWIEEPFTHVSQLEGDITGDNMGRILEMMEFIGGGQGPIIIMQDLSKAGAFTAAARKNIMNDPNNYRVRVVICIGASFQMRVFITMIAKATKFVDPRLATTLFAKNDSEAREMLAAERKRLQQQA
jgi:hypothetical protein